MLLAIVQLSCGGFWTVDIPSAITEFKKIVEYVKNWMGENSPESELQECYVVQVLHELSQEGLENVVYAKFNKGEDHGTHVDINFVNFNHMGFNPKLHVFVCHKCCKALTSGSHNIPSCSCISGWIRPYQKYRPIEDSEKV